VEEHLHTAQQEIIRHILQQDPSFFVASTPLLPVAGTETYILPENARRGTRLIFVESTSDVGSEVAPAEMRNYLAYRGGIVNLCTTLSFVLEGDRVRIMPTPTDASTVTVWYSPSFGNMIEGSNSATVISSAVTMVLTAQTVPNYTTTFGVISPRDDYYNGMTIEMTSGAAIGRQRTITNYVGSTRTVTVSAVWGVALAAGDTCIIHCPVPEDFHDLVPLRGAILGSARNRNRQQELEALYFGRYGTTGRLDELMGWVARRSDAQVEVVGYVDHGD
jgi:hypothetical protein